MHNLPTLAQVRSMLAAIRADVAALATLERWPPELVADIEDRLRRAPAVSLPEQAAHFARRLRDERVRRGLMPATLPEPQPSSALPHVVLGPAWLHWWRKRKRRGIAKALAGQHPIKTTKGKRRAFLEDFPEEQARYKRLIEGEPTGTPR
ncbi:hypothetical protein [Cupriavidus sp. SS-3]|uniref:hypothetical protein n=1 Tax=Cupriavidus sp. SS-3 TaxID=3109596 RepID=UPI002DB6C22F|nr:hypothetical protein [Cupriavidus sp. SS-3]MEC3769053.1 hypothetical protein [Cupriavidus sp. SS-3]